MKKKGFTLMELTIAITIFAVMFSVIFSVYSHLLKTKLSLDARALVITTTYDLVEKINVVLQNYTIDYEEYFNRGMVGCKTYTCTPGTCSNIEGDTIPMRSDWTIVPAISMWPGKVNQHFDVETQLWKSDEGVAGADRDKLEYCQIYYPETVSYAVLHDVTIRKFCDAFGNCNNATIKTGYECVQPSYPSGFGSGFKRQTSDLGNCLEFDAMGNFSPYATNEGMGIGEGISLPTHNLYNCSSDLTLMDNDEDGIVEDPSHAFLTGSLAVQIQTTSDKFCYERFLALFGGNSPFYQPFGQYAKQFIDVKEDVDDKPGRAGDDDDTDIGTGPIAIYDNKNVKELYLIAKDKKTRVFIRNKLIESGDVNGDALITLPQEKHFVLQMLQLKAFDAGENHDFVSAGTYDGVIDTWACDASAGFVCNGPKVSDVYSGYRLPANGDDGWINLTNNDISVFSRNMEILPTKDPKLAWADPSSQMNPFIKLNLTTGMYGKSRWSRIGSGSMSAVTYDLQTSFNIKSNY